MFGKWSSEDKNTQNRKQRYQSTKALKIVNRTTENQKPKPKLLIHRKPLKVYKKYSKCRRFSWKHNRKPFLNSLFSLSNTRQMMSRTALVGGVFYIKSHKTYHILSNMVIYPASQLALPVQSIDIKILEASITVRRSSVVRRPHTAQRSQWNIL